MFGYTLTGADGTHSSLLIAPDSLALNGGSIKDVDNMLDAAIEHQGAGAFYVQQVVDETAPEVQSAAVGRRHPDTGLQRGSGHGRHAARVRLRRERQRGIPVHRLRVRVGLGGDADPGLGGGVG